MRVIKSMSMTNQHAEHEAVDCQASNGLIARRGAAQRRPLRAGVGMGVGVVGARRRPWDMAPAAVSPSRQTLKLAAHEKHNVKHEFSLSTKT